MLGTGFIVGGFVYPYVLGAIKDTTGSFVTGFFGVTVATLILCFLPALFGRDQRSGEPSEVSASEAAGVAEPGPG